MKKIKVSIIIPVYGVEKYIDKCLNSLVNQTLKEIEIIVVNDGSKDNSQKIIDKYVKKYPNKVKSFIKENGGQGSARNFGLQKAVGEYIGYVDGDDYVELDMYEKLYKKAEEEKSEIVICGNYIVDENYINKIADLPILKYNTIFDNILFGKIAVWNKIYKKNILVDNELEFRKKVWYEDLPFTVKCTMLAKSYSIVSEPLYNYIIREGSTMNNSNVKRNLEILIAFDDILEYINKNNKHEYKEHIEFLAIDHIYISTIVRIIRAKADKKIKKDIIKELITYMNKNFPDFKKNKYIKKLPKNRKIIYYMIKLKMYYIIKVLFKIKKV